MIADYVATIPEEQRAESATYTQRLALCGTCHQLRDGTCGLCGCYVEARAAKRAQRCPAIPPYWIEEEWAGDTPSGKAGDSETDSAKTDIANETTIML